MKKYYSKVWIYTLLSALGITPAIYSPKAYAADPQGLIGTTTYIKANEQQDLSVPDREDVQASTDSVLMEQVGGWTELPFAGHRLGVRIGFVNGDFDRYAETFKAEPVVQLKDLDKDLTYPYVRAGQSRTFIGEKLKISVAFNKPKIIIRNDNSPQEEKVIRYAELLKKWAGSASKSCANHLGRKICLISQTIWDGRAWRYGFVATEGTPLYYTTNYPQAFVELYRTENGERSYKPTAHSVALRIAFVYVPHSANGGWNIRKMTDEEIGEAMVDYSSENDILPPGNEAPASAGVKRDAVDLVKRD